MLLLLGESAPPTLVTVWSSGTWLDGVWSEGVWSEGSESPATDTVWAPDAWELGAWLGGVWGEASGSEEPTGPTSQYLDAFSVELALHGFYHDVVLADEPVGFWMLGEYFTDVAAKDFSGYGHDGAFAGAMTFGNRGPFPHGGTAIALDGSTGYVNVGDVAAYEFVGARSIEFWMKFTSNQAHAYLVSKGFADVVNGFQVGDGWSIEVLEGVLRFVIKTAAGEYVVFAGTDSDIPYNDGEWHHVVVTWDGGIQENEFPLLLSDSLGPGEGFVYFYVDGELASEGISFGATPGVPATARLLIGAKDEVGSASVDGCFDGEIKGVAIYDYALHWTQVADHYATATWTDVTNDVLTSPGVALEYGTMGSKPLDRLADTGLLEFSLNNSAANSAGLAGYYSPNHANVRAGFTFDVPVRVTMTYDEDTHQRFWGRVAVIDPEPGQYRNRATHVLANDYMAMLTDTSVRHIPPQVDESETTLMQRVFQSMPIDAQPMALDLHTAVDTYTYAFDDIQGGVQAATALNKLLVSAWGRGFTSGNGTFTYRNRQATIGQVLSLTVDDDMMEMQAATDRASVFNSVAVVTHPRVVDVSATTVLYSHPTAPLLLPGASLEFFGDYRNPDNEVMTVGGTEMATPVSGTDFIANSLADGSGTVLTGSVTATAEFFASAVKWTLTNNHGSLGAYFTTLQARGKGIYDLAPLTTESPVGRQGNRPITVDLAYQDDANVGQGLADFILHERAVITDPIDSITVSPHRSAEMLSFVVDCEPGRIIAVSETQTGLSEAQAMIRSLRLEIGSGEIMTATIGLVPVMVGDAWILGEDLLGVSTVLGYA